MSGGRTLYWLLTGACIGFGIIAILSIGIFFLAAGLILLVVGASRFRGRGLWAALVGFGGAPALLLLWDVVSGPWGCITPGGGDSQPGVSYYNCVQTPIGQLTSYHVMAFGFGVIALAGLTWPLLRRLVTRSFDRSA